ncbi:MAG: hypothetical protein HOP04_08035 [Methylophilaceae bacterium]|nr:hypothetical protein [Methylophilaceae bacterium]
MSEEQENLKEVVVRQIKLGYSPTEDRLMFEITMTEKDKLVVWLTRKAVKTMWQILHGHYPEDSSKPAVQPDKPAELLQGETLDAVTKNLDLLETLMPRTPLFNMEMFVAYDCSIAKSENGVSILDMNCQNGKVVKVALNQDLTQAITQMLQQVTAEAAWDLNFSDAQSFLGGVPISPVLH